MSGEEEESEEEESRAPEPSGPSEAELAMQRRRAAPKKIDASALDEEAQELLEANAELRAKMSEEIDELRERSERRKKEREQEDRDNAKRRAEEETRRKKEEEDRQNKKLEEEGEKRDARAAKLAEFEKFKNDSKPNFIITKKTGAGADTGDDEDDEAGENKKSKEQLEAEKKAILEQRIPKLEIDGADTSKLTDKAKELHALIMRLESEKYDLEKRFKAQQYDMMELAERARQMNKVGKGGQLKRVQLTEDVSDIMQERFAGCPSKILMFSEFERQTDSRSWGERHAVFKGAHFLYPAERVQPTRIMKFNEASGQPEYQYIPGMEPKDEPEEEE